jgi:hypothetical protein
VQTEAVGLLRFLFLHHLKIEKLGRQKRGGYMVKKKIIKMKKKCLSIPRKGWLERTK